MMSIQKKSNREKFIQLRQTLLHLSSEIVDLVKPLFSARPVIKGTVYELKRKCGKPGCKCAQGELHSRMVVSASEKGKTKLKVVPQGSLIEVYRTPNSGGQPRALCRFSSRDLVFNRHQGGPGPMPQSAGVPSADIKRSDIVNSMLLRSDPFHLPCLLDGCQSSHLHHAGLYRNCSSMTMAL